MSYDSYASGGRLPYLPLLSETKEIRFVHEDHEEDLAKYFWGNTVKLDSPNVLSYSFTPGYLLFIVP